MPFFNNSRGTMITLLEKVSKDIPGCLNNSRGTMITLLGKVSKGL
jgi:hypothetical protein